MVGHALLRCERGSSQSHFDYIGSHCWIYSVLENITCPLTVRLLYLFMYPMVTITLRFFIFYFLVGEGGGGLFYHAMGTLLDLMVWFWEGQGLPSWIGSSGLASCLYLSDQDVGSKALVLVGEKGWRLDSSLDLFFPPLFIKIMSNVVAE